MYALLNFSTSAISPSLPTFLVVSISTLLPAARYTLLLDLYFFCSFLGNSLMPVLGAILLPQCGVLAPALLFDVSSSTSLFTSVFWLMVSFCIFSINSSVSHMQFTDSAMFISLVAAAYTLSGFANKLFVALYCVVDHYWAS